MVTVTAARQFGTVVSDVGQINEVTLHRVWLVLGWVTVSGSTVGEGNLSLSNQPPRSTQPGHPSMGRRNEYRPKERKKEKEEYLYSAFIQRLVSRRSDMDHTVSPANYTMPAFPS